MAGTRFDFANAHGEQLSGVLETGPVPPRAYAVFAHCFTCDKTSLAATRLSRAIAGHGIGVLRFDFTGLGASEGDFGRGLSGDVADLVAAAEALAAAGKPPQLLIGHSFGGAAVLAAAGSLDMVRAVATIAAPFDAAHVLDQIDPASRAAVDAAGNGRVPVSIGGRPFELGRAFIDDIAAAAQDARIAGLRRALLVLHSPTDAVVGIANASHIFLTAKHPKSFVSLDDADHLLRRKADADYAAAMIATWASRYVDLAPEDTIDPPARGVRVETGDAPFEVRAVTAARPCDPRRRAAIGRRRRHGTVAGRPYQRRARRMHRDDLPPLRDAQGLAARPRHRRDRAHRTYRRRSRPLRPADRLRRRPRRGAYRATVRDRRPLPGPPHADRGRGRGHRTARRRRGVPRRSDDHRAAMDAACADR